MAEVKIYRAAYVKGDSEGASVRFSGWVQAEGLDEAQALLLTAIFAGSEILGWEEKSLDTEPI